MTGYLNSYYVIIAVYYLLLSLITFIIYAADKRAARRQQWRVRERTLHLLALAGGWPGAWLAQKYLRHKSGKASFLFGFRLTLLGNLAIVAYILLYLIRD